MYELLYIVPVPYTEKDLEGISQKIKKIISDLEGTITHEKNLGGKKLSYPIKSIHRGFYLLVHFDINAKKLDELNQKLKLTSEVLRHMITVAIKIQPRLKIRPKREKEKFDDTAFAAHSAEVASSTETEKATTDKEEKDVSAESPPETKKEEEKKTKKSKKLDLKKLGDKIDELLKI